MEATVGAVLPILAEKLCNYAASQNQNLRQLKHEIEKTEEKYRVLTSILKDAQKLKRTHMNYNTAKTILAQIREWVYDADDILLDCHMQAAYENLSILHRYTPRALSFPLSAANRLDQLNIRIENLRADISQVNQMIQHCDEGSIQESSSTANPDNIIGMKEETEDIIGYITGEKKRRIGDREEEMRRIGIVGMGGLGKTTMALKVFNDQRVIDHFKERIWISVGRTFRPKDILTSMWNQIKKSASDKSVHVLDDEMTKIRQALCNKEYLIVMDDVWEPDYHWWIHVMPSYLPEGEKSHKSILITTRNEGVATNMNVNHIHPLKKLSEEESWILFCEKANEKSKDPEFRAVGEEIVEKCHGLPLAIKTVSALLSSKVHLGQWKEARDNFSDVLAKYSDTLSSSIQLSYDNLSAKLKNCLLSFSIYPGDCEVNAEQLVYWWVSEGFVDGIEDAFQCLTELVNRCLVEAVQRGFDRRVYRCRMHDMVREWIIETSQEETFSSFDEKNREIPGVNTRRLGYTSKMEEKLPENNSKLRAFLLVENCVLPSPRCTALDAIKTLRVLDLSQNEEESINAEALLRWIRYQKRLAYLNLRKVSGLKDLPDWIKEHQNLQILVIRECFNLKRLPSSITTLQKLVVLDVENCALENLPRGLGRLTKLQVLSGFKLRGPGKDGASLHDLKTLKELRVLGIKLCKKDLDISDNEEDILSQLEHLKVLFIDTMDCEKKQVLGKEADNLSNVGKLPKDCEQKQVVDEEEDTKDRKHKEVVVVNKLVPPRTLQELYLRSYRGDTTPNWVSPTCLPELQYLCIEDSQLTRVSTDFWAGNETSWVIEGLCFRQLLSFNIDWEYVYDKMKQLRYVEIRGCPGLHPFPHDLNNGIWERK